MIIIFTLAHTVAVVGVIVDGSRSVMYVLLTFSCNIFKSGEFGGHILGGTNSGVFSNNLIVARAR